MRIFKASLWLISLMMNPCFAANVQTSQLSDITKILTQKADQTTLVIFDVDDVLIAPTDEFAIRDPIRKKLNKELFSRHGTTEIKVLYSDFFRKRTVRLVNPGMIDLLKDLRDKKIPATALTKWYTGRYGSIAMMENLRFKGLDEVGISFIEISPFIRNMEFPDLKTEDGIPMVKNGIILTAFADKGLVLEAALVKAQLKFKKIIFIDDSYAQIQSVEKICNKLGIAFIGIHYTEANLIPIPLLNASKEKLRFEVLEKEHVWLLDQTLEKRWNK
jgi:FMN phosphatase YigB (HAD superfamily)